MAITNRNELNPGTLMVGKYKKHEFFLKAVEGGFVRVHDAKPDAKDIKSQGMFTSLSAAASKIRGCPTNGQKFWTVLEHPMITQPRRARTETRAPEMAQAAANRRGRAKATEEAKAEEAPKKRGRAKKAA